MDDKKALKHLININKTSLEDTLSMLDKIDPNLYYKKLSIIHNNSISMHFRHIDDFWSCFYSGLQSKKIDYNKRNRNKELENSKDKMREKITLTIKLLKKISSETLTVSDQLIEPGSRIEINSNTNRELLFLYEHTIHHIYIIRMVLNSLGIEVENKHIGYNLSTLKKIQCVS